MHHYFNVCQFVGNTINSEHCTQITESGAAQLSAGDNLQEAASTESVLVKIALLDYRYNNGRIKQNYEDWLTHIASLIGHSGRQSKFSYKLSTLKGLSHHKPITWG